MTSRGERGGVGGGGGESARGGAREVRRQRARRATRARRRARVRATPGAIGRSVRRTREIARTCESGGAWACAMKAAESSRGVRRSGRARRAAVRVDDDDDDDALDDPDDPDDDRAKCEAERKELERECHDAYAEIKRKISEIGEISRHRGNETTRQLGQDVRVQGDGASKKCRPPPPPRVAVTA